MLSEQEKHDQQLLYKILWSLGGEGGMASAKKYGYFSILNFAEIRKQIEMIL